MKPLRLLLALLCVAALAFLAGCDVFQIHPSDPGPESGMIVGKGGPGVGNSAGGTGMDAHSEAGPPQPMTGTSTRGMGTGYSGPITAPGPGREGR